MNVPGLTLSPEEFSAAFPFHFAIDYRLRLVQCGPKFSTICARAEPGALIVDLLEIKRPEVQFTTQDITRNLKTLFLIECKSSGVTLRGQMLPLAGTETLLFLGSPWFTESQDVVLAGLAFDDFAIHDPGIDMLMALQAQQMGYQEVKGLAGQLSKQRAELRSANAALQSRNDALQAARDALHKTSESLRTTASRLEVIVRNLHEGIIVEDAEHRIVLANDLFCQMFGIPGSASLVGADCRAAGRESAKMFVSSENFLARVGQIVVGQQTILGEELALVSGRTYARDYVPIMDGLTCVGHLWAYRDVTPRKRAEEELRADRNLLATTLSSMVDGVIAVDGKQRIQLINSAALQMIGIKASEAVGQPIDAVLHFQTRRGQSVPCPVAESFFRRERAGNIYDSDNAVMLRSRQGQLVSVVFSATPFASGDGPITGGLVIFRDVSAEAKVEQMKRNFVDSVSHELRTPLSSIKGFIKSLQQDDLLPLSVWKESLNIAHEQATRLTSLVDDILELSLIESGQVQFRNELVQIAQIARLSLTETLALAQGKGIVIEFNPQRDLGEGRIFADPSRIQSMITNLLTNAIKFTPNGGTISMMLDSNGREILLSVRDTGVGIHRDQHTRIFRKFYRVDRENKAIPGTGLGLPIVLSIVEHYGGRIEVESEEGKGSCFRVYLPVLRVLRWLRWSRRRAACLSLGIPAGCQKVAGG